MTTHHTTSGAETLVRNCAGVNQDDIVLIVCNPSTYEVASDVLGAALECCSNVVLSIVPEVEMHGKEPPAYVATQMLESTVIFGLTSMSMAHTSARINANAKGVRYLSMPDYSKETLASRALQIDFQSLIPEAKRIADLLTSAHELLITSELGTHITIDVTGRIGNAAPGCVNKNLLLASPPDAEANVPPRESGSNGRIVVDGSIPCKEIGLLKETLTLEVRNGRIVSFEGSQASTLKELHQRTGNANSMVLAEVGIGLNPEARLIGSMLEDEGVLGTIHFGFGSNSTIGGLNKVAFHLDHVITKPSLMIDGVQIIVDGEILKK